MKAQQIENLMLNTTSSATPASSSAPVMRTFHLLKTLDILLANDNRLLRKCYCVSSLSVNSIDNSIEPAED